MDESVKLAAEYDETGRELARALFKTARKLPPGMFSGKRGILKLLAGGALLGGSYAGGKARAQSAAKQDDVAIAQQAYRAGIQRGAQAVLQRLRGM